MSRSRLIWQVAPEVRLRLCFGVWCEYVKLRLAFGGWGQRVLRVTSRSQSIPGSWCLVVDFNTESHNVAWAATTCELALRLSIHAASRVVFNEAAC